MKSQGLGDSIEKVIKSLKLDQVVKKSDGSCEPCKKRKEKLNKTFPYRKPTI